MGVLSSLGRFFSLDVLDGQHRTKDPSARLRWRTPEFYFYYLVFILVVPLMFKSVIDISKPEHFNYPLYKQHLSPGFLRPVDNSDSQYASFRDQVPTLAIVMLAHTGLRIMLERVMPSVTRVSFDVTFGLIFLVVLHGFGALKVLTIATFTYNIAKLGRNTIVNPVLTWATIIGLLFMNEWHQGYKFAGLHPALAIMDEYSGLLDRWHIHFNITALRLISFNLDYYWSLASPASPSKKTDSEVSERQRIESPAQPKEYNYFNFIAYVLYTPLYLAGPILTFNNYVAQTKATPSTITRSRTIAYGLRFLVSLVTMELVLHFIYVVAISKAQAWTNLSAMEIAMLGYFNLHIIWLKLLIPWRFFRLWAMMDGVETTENMIRCMSNNYSALAFWRAWHRSFNRWITRYIYIPLATSSPFKQQRPSSSSSSSAATKALNEKVAPTHTISAVGDSTYTTTPTTPDHGTMSVSAKDKDSRTSSGSEKRSRSSKSIRAQAGSVSWTIFNMLCVFSFVAIWHDISLTLLTWGWLIVFFLIPELLLTHFAAPYRRAWWFRYVSACGAVCNILSMMAANLVGFAVGVDGVKSMIAAMFGSVAGFAVLGGSAAALFVGVQIMFEVREDEAARGIFLRC